MKISVVIPAYNEEKYIKACLESVTHQESQADEIIVVDNNCTDQTIAIAKQFNIKIVLEKTQGISYARNAGFNTAKGEIIARCDADTIVPKNWLTTFQKHFRDQKIDAVCGSLIYSDLPVETKVYMNLYLDFMRLAQTNKETLIGMNMAIRKSMWHKIKDKVIMDNSLVHEDIDLALWIWQAGGRVVYDKDLVVKSSARRLKSKPWSFFFEYPVRMAKTFSLPRRL